MIRIVAQPSFEFESSKVLCHTNPGTGHGKIESQKIDMKYTFTFS